MQVMLWAESGRAYVVEASTDLVGWTPLGTALAGDAGLFFTDVSAEALMRRFYRARLAQ